MTQCGRSQVFRVFPLRQFSKNAVSLHAQVEQHFKRCLTTRRVTIVSQYDTDLMSVP